MERLVELLIKRGANINAAIEDEQGTMLHYFAKNSNYSYMGEKFVFVLYFHILAKE